MSTTLADLDGPQAPAIVAALGERLVLAVRDEVPAGPVTDRSIHLDDEGLPRLVAASGGSPPPIEAPEAPRTGPTAETALHDVGVILYRLATGTTPRSNPGRPGPPPAPGTRVADLPPGLDQAIALLLHPEPARRHEALALLHDAAGPLPDLRRLARATSTDRPPDRPSLVGEVRLTRTGGDEAGVAHRAEIPALRHALVIPPDRAAALDPADRSALAGRLGVPASAVKALIGEGRPVPVEVGLRARDVAPALRRTEVPVEAVPPPGVAFPLLAIAAGLGGLGLLGVAAVLAVVSTLTALGVGAGALVPLAGAALLTVLWRARATAHREVDASRRELDRVRAATTHDDETGEAWGRLARARVALAEADLPPVADADLRGALDQLEAELHVLTGEDRADPDRLARTGAGLDELVATLEAAGRADHAGLDATLDEALTAARRAADALDAAEGPTARARRATQREREGR